MRGNNDATKIKRDMEEKEARYQQIIGQQSYEIDWLKKIWPQTSPLEGRKTMAEPDNRRITLARQAYFLTLIGPEYTGNRRHLRGPSLILTI